MITSNLQGPAFPEALAIPSGRMDPERALSELRKILVDCWTASGLKQEAFAHELGVKRSYVSNVKGGRLGISPQVGEKLIEKFGADPARVRYLLARIKKVQVSDPAHATPTPTRSRTPREGHYPVVGLAACGKWEDEGDVERHPWGEVVTTDLFTDVKASSRAYVVYAKGTSMTGSGIHEGDALLVDPKAPLSNGRIALVRVDGKVTVKQWRELSDRVLLTATNPDYKPQEIELVKDENDDRLKWAHRIIATRPAVKLL